MGPCESASRLHPWRFSAPWKRHPRDACTQSACETKVGRIPTVSMISWEDWPHLRAEGFTRSRRRSDWEPSDTESERPSIGSNVRRPAFESLGSAVRWEPALGNRVQREATRASIHPLTSPSTARGGLTTPRRTRNPGAHLGPRKASDRRRRASAGVCKIGSSPLPDQWAMHRQARGELPTMRRKVTAKWLGLGNPVRSATSDTDRFDARRSAFARSTRVCIRYR
jgi:hypothetical protein